MASSFSKSSFMRRACRVFTHALGGGELFSVLRYAESFRIRKGKHYLRLLRKFRADARIARATIKFLPFAIYISRYSEAKATESCIKPEPSVPSPMGN